MAFSSIIITIASHGIRRRRVVRALGASTKRPSAILAHKRLSLKHHAAGSSAARRVVTKHAKALSKAAGSSTPQAPRPPHNTNDYLMSLHDAPASRSSVAGVEHGWNLNPFGSFLSAASS